MSQATLYRWQEQELKSSSYPRPTKMHLSIEDALARLCDAQDDSETGFLEALFKLVAWCRWPDEPEVHPAAITMCIAAYLSADPAIETLADLREDRLQLLLNNFRTDTLKRVFSHGMLGLPLFDLFHIRDQPYTEVDFLADITWFMLAFEPASKDKRDAASLTKAYWASQNEVFRFHWPQSQDTFKRRWRHFGAAAAFHYVNREHPALDLTLNPTDSYFAQSVDDILAHRPQLRQHLGRCRGATEMLAERLDPRTRERLALPAFPKSLPAERIVPRSLPSSTREVINMHGRRDKRAVKSVG